MPPFVWASTGAIDWKEFTCGHCGRLVASEKGYYADPRQGGQRLLIYICPCGKPNYFQPGGQIPGIPFGNEVEGLQEDINQIYQEARKSYSVGAYTGAVMLCRKMLMNIAVSKSAPADQTFASYVKYLADKGYVPPDGQKWVDFIREKGNEANHQIKLMTKEDAEALISFLEMLLRFIYEFPNRLPKPPSAPS